MLAAHLVVRHVVHLHTRQAPSPHHQLGNRKVRGLSWVLAAIDPQRIAAGAPRRVAHVHTIGQLQVRARVCAAHDQPVCVGADPVGQSSLPAFVIGHSRPSTMMPVNPISLLPLQDAPLVAACVTSQGAHCELANKLCTLECNLAKMAALWSVSFIMRCQDLSLCASCQILHFPSCPIPSFKLDSRTTTADCSC